MEVGTLIAACIAAACSIFALVSELKFKKKNRLLEYKKEALFNLLKLSCNYSAPSESVSIGDLMVAFAYVRAVCSDKTVNVLEDLEEKIRKTAQKRKNGDSTPFDLNSSVDRVMQAIKLELKTAVK